MECILIRWEARTRTLCDRSQNLPISSEHDLTYDIMTWWPDMTSTWNFSQFVSNWSAWGYCKIRGDPPRFTRVNCEKKHGGSVRPPLTSALLTRQPLGLRATRQPLGGHKVAPLYFCEDIVATQRDREAKLCAHLPVYLAKVVSKFGVDPI